MPKMAFFMEEEEDESVDMVFNDEETLSHLPPTMYSICKTSMRIMSMMTKMASGVDHTRHCSE